MGVTEVCRRTTLCIGDQMIRFRLGRLIPALQQGARRDAAIVETGPKHFALSRSKTRASGAPGSRKPSADNPQTGDGAPRRSAGQRADPSSQ
jgi:hypothetical protein